MFYGHVERLDHRRIGCRNDRLVYVPCASLSNANGVDDA